MEGYWKKPDDPFRILVAQTEQVTERGRLLEIADKWYQQRQRKSDRVLAVDELLDFYHRNTISVHSSRDVPLKVVRAGGERGFGALYGAQRPKRSATANHGRTVGTVPFSPSLRCGHQIPLGYGNSSGYRAAERIRRRLRLSHHPHPARWQMRIRPDLQANPVGCISFSAV